MECLLCTMWARMPYAKRSTTPTSTQETEGALIVGYWIARRQNAVPRICKVHMSILTLLDEQDERRIETERLIQQEAERAAQPQLPTHLQLQVDELQERKQTIATGVASQLRPQIPQPTSEPIVSFPTAPLPVTPVPSGEFQLGPGPLTNENVITPHPPLPVFADPTAPYRAQINAIGPPIKKGESAEPGTREGALEAALAPPVEGAKVVYPCPSCGKEIATGDVHAC